MAAPRRGRAAPAPGHRRRGHAARDDGRRDRGRRAPTTRCVSFEPPLSSREASYALGLVAIAAVGVAAFGLVGGVSTTFAAVAAAVVAVALGLLAWRLRPNRSHVRIDHGLVDIVVGDRQHRFDLNNDNTDLEVVGSPGERDWQVQFLRRGLEPVAVDARMVDGEAFTEALRKWRPGCRTCWEPSAGPELSPARP